MMVKETHSDGSSETDWKKEWDGDVILSHLFSKMFLPVSYEAIEHRAIAVRSKYELYTVVFVNVYSLKGGPDRVCLFVELPQRDVELDSALGFRKLDRNDGEPHATWKRVMKLRVLTVSMGLDRLYCFKHHVGIFKECLLLPVCFSDHSVLSCSVFIAHMRLKSAY